MALWLFYDDPTDAAESVSIRARALERLNNAVFRSEWAEVRSRDRDEARQAAWLHWLIGEIEDANRFHDDVVPAFLRRFRWLGKLTDPLAEILMTWLTNLEQTTPPPRPEVSDLIRGAKIMIDPTDRNEDDLVAEWVALLDDPSQWVRGCAADSLGIWAGQDTTPSLDDLMALIGAKELERPGIAGPFFGARYYGDASEYPKAKDWMLDLLERRSGPEMGPDGMPFNDIWFYLHEPCSFSPEDVRGMMNGGFFALAVETATEESQAVDDMMDPLEALTRNPDPHIAARAERHLKMYYGFNAEKDQGSDRGD